MKLLYIVGIPGAGKSSVIKLLTKNLKQKIVEVPIQLRGVNRDKTLRVVYTKYNRYSIQLGYDRGDWSGTDALDKAIFPYMQHWLGTQDRFRFVLGEGDRFSSAKFFDWCEEIGIELTVAALVVDEEIANERRAKRDEKVKSVGMKRKTSSQNPTWLAGRRTKVYNVIDKYVEKEWMIDASRSRKEVARDLLRHPVIKAIRMKRS